jgi:hypothetical protein
VARLGGGARNTVAIQNRLIKAEKVFKGAKYLGYGAKGAFYANEYVMPYFNPPATGQSDEAPSTLDTFVRGDADDEAPSLRQVNLKLGDVLTADQSRMQDIREF